MEFWLVERTDDFELGDVRSCVIRAGSEDEAIESARRYAGGGEWEAAPLAADGPTEVILREPHCAC